MLNASRLYPLADALQIRLRIDDRGVYGAREKQLHLGELTVELPLVIEASVMDADADGAGLFCRVRGDLALFVTCTGGRGLALFLLDRGRLPDDVVMRLADETSLTGAYERIKAGIVREYVASTGDKTWVRVEPC